MAVAGIVLIMLGLFAGIIPFVGPLFGFGMGPDPAWIMTTSRLVRHVIPAAAVIIGGAMLLPRARTFRTTGATLAILGGAWLTVAPIVLGRGGEGVPPLIDIVRPLAYHFATGVAVAVLAGFAAGRMSRPDSVEVPAREVRREPVPTTRATEA